ncbi:MAG: 3'-5' exonuclease [Bryobacterales bacterium]|nr:3'-5' exonuclease [Bryobacterales bacterium]
MADIPSKWQGFLDSETVLILDTETTGLTQNSEIVEIAIINTKGETLLDTVVLPKGPIPTKASDIHGLTRPRLKKMDAKPWMEYQNRVSELLSSAKVVVIYNANFDTRMLQQTAQKHGFHLNMPDRKFNCAMLDYAEFRGKRGKYGDFRWHKLGDAFRRETGKSPSKAHRALDDCKMVLELMRSVSVKVQPTPDPRPKRARQQRYGDYDDKDDHSASDSGCLGSALLVATIIMVAVYAVLAF